MSLVDALVLFALSAAKSSGLAGGGAAPALPPDVQAATIGFKPTIGIGAPGPTFVPPPVIPYVTGGAGPLPPLPTPVPTAPVTIPTTVTIGPLGLPQQAPTGPVLPLSVSKTYLIGLGITGASGLIVGSYLTIAPAPNTPPWGLAPGGYLITP